MNKDIYGDKKIAALQYKKEESYWLEKLSGSLEMTGFPYDRNNGGAGKPPPDRHNVKFIFPEELFSKLMIVTHGADSAIYMVLAAGLTLLLHKYSHHRDIIFAAPIYKQNTEVSFINTVLPLRNYLDQGITFKKLLFQMKQTIIEAEENQNYPVELLFDRLDTPFPGNELSLFDVAILLGNIHKREYLSPLTPNTVFSFQGTGKSLELELEYNPIRYEKATIERLGIHFISLLQKALSNIDAKVSGLELISEEEKKKLLFDFNDTGQLYPAHQTIHGLFADQVKRIPDHICVVGVSSNTGMETGTGNGFEPVTRGNMNYITYKKLNQASDQMAQLLQKKGLQPDTIVGIMMERSLDMVIGLLGILKAGGAYLPVDPQLPVNRLVYLLEESGASLLLTGTHTIADKPFIMLKSLYQVRVKPLVTGARAQVTDLDNLPLPDRSLVNYDQYMNHIGQSWVTNCIAFMGARGCPFKCAYCHKIWPDKHVTRSAENMFAELELYYRMGVRRFAIIDDIFNFNKKNSTRFFQLIIDNGFKVQLYFPNGLRGDLLTREYIDLMVEAGTSCIALALETASPRLQKLVGKHLQLEKFRENLLHLCETYPQVISELFTMHGFPGETEEEAQMTLDFIKSIKWVHFPYINILRIYSNTNMYKLAVENGISPRAIFNSENLYFHELPETLPFSKSFTAKLQTQFLNEYFLAKERLLHVLPHQMKIYTQYEITRKYDSYLPFEINTFSQILEAAGISADQLGTDTFLDEGSISVPHLHEKMKAYFPAKKPAQDALRILLLDLSQFFNSETNRLDNIYEPPLGLITVMSYINRKFGARVNGRIVKSRTDFDNYSQLRVLLKEFRPDVIGIRTMTYYRDFFHRTLALIRHWGIHIPVIVGGPYAASNYNTLLQDRNVDLAVLGEGEITFSELIEKIIENKGELPGEEVLKDIPGLAFIPRKKQTGESSRDIVLVDEIPANPPADPGINKKITSNHSQSPRNLAYVMFTSGSAGKPKGVMVEHKNVVNLLTWFGKAYGLGPGTHVLQMSEYNFDPSVEDIFGSLVHGSVLYVGSRELVLDPALFAQFVQDHHIHLVDFVPSLLKVLICRNPDPEKKLESLRVVISGGEPLPDEVKDRLLEKGYRLYNNYGPTEVTVDALSWECSGQKVNLGKPIANVKCYIVDKEANPVPLLVPGELYISGAGIARGYLNLPGLTAEKFQENPFAPGEKIYKTGDLARWMPHQGIEFLGRIDQQVKIRGFRIELGEIESLLLKVKGVKQAVVLDKEFVKDEKCLCAYIVIDPGAIHGNIPGSEDLRTYLSTCLPPYMVPSHFTIIDSIPLTSNGKVDRKALPDPIIKKGDKYVSPQDKVEEKLVEIWEEVLFPINSLEAPQRKSNPQPLIGMDDHFFELGGHSLNATRMAAKIHKELNVKIPLVEIFKNPTVRSIANFVKAANTDILPAVKSTEKKEYYVLSSAQKRLYILQRMEPGSTAYNIPLAMKLEEYTEPEKLQAAFAELIARHEIFRTSFEMIHQEPVQKIHDRVEFEIRVEDENNMQHFIRPFDLSHAPLMRVGLVKPGKEKYILIVDMHHIISDGRSHEILTDEFMALLKGEKLPPLKLRYKDYAEWQHQASRWEEIKKQQEYWLAQFEPEIPLLNIPTDYPRPMVMNREGSAVMFHVNQKQTEALNKMALQEDATLFMVILAAFNIMLAKYSQQEDIVVGTTITGRKHEDLQNIAGMFVNVLPIRNFPAMNKTFGEFFKEVRQKVLDAYENQDFQFDDLVTLLGLKRDLNRNPLVDVIFNFQYHEEPEEQPDDMPEVKSPAPNPEPYQLGLSGLKFDMVIGAAVRKNGIYLNINYCSNLFKRETAEQMSIHLNNILAEVIRDPGVKISGIEMLAEEEKYEILEKLGNKNFDLIISPLENENIEADEAGFDF